MRAFGTLEPLQVRQIGYLQSLECSTQQNLLGDLKMYCTHERLEDGMPETLLFAVPSGRHDVIAEIERVLGMSRKVRGKTSAGETSLKL